MLARPTWCRRVMVHQIVAVVVMVLHGALAGIAQPHNANEMAASMQAAFAKDDVVTTMAAVRRLVVECKRVRAARAAGRTTDDELRATDAVTDNALRFLATTWHNQSSGMPREDAQPKIVRANELYETYLELFPLSPNAHEMRFFHA